MNTISAQALHEHLNHYPDSIVLDVRSPAEHAREHLAGSRLLPLSQIRAAAVLAIPRPVNQPVFLLCRSGSRARLALERLETEGFGCAVIVEGGTEAWTKAGLPLNRGANRVISLERQVRIAAGIVVLLGVLLAIAVNQLFIGLSFLAGAGLVLAGVTDWCGLCLVLRKARWNRQARETLPSARATSSAAQ